MTYMIEAQSAFEDYVRGKFIARSASDRTDDWYFWMVWDGSLNVTGKVAEKLGYGNQEGAVFTRRANAERLASEANARGI